MFTRYVNSRCARLRESDFLERSKLLLCMLAGPRSQLSCKSVEAVKDQLV